MTVPILAPYNTIFIRQGAHRDISMTVTDPDGKSLNLTGCHVYLAVKENASDEANVIFKSSNDAAQIQITNALAGTVTIHFVAADTKSKTAKEYVFDIWVVDGSNAAFPVVELSPFVIQPRVTFL